MLVQQPQGLSSGPVGCTSGCEWRGNCPMELADYLRVIRKYWRSVAAVLLVSLFAAALVTVATLPTYTAGASVFVSVDSGSSASDLQSGSTYAENQVKSFAQIATMPAVLDPVIEQLGLNMTAVQLSKMVTSTVPAGTAIIQVEYVDTSPQAAAFITNAIARQLTVVVAQLSPGTKNGEQPVLATIVAPASVPTEKTSPKVLLNLAIGALAGLLLGLAQAVLRSRFDTTVVEPEDVSAITDYSLVGTVGIEKEIADHPLIVYSNRQFSTRAEEYRRLRTNLQFLTVDSRTRVVVVTSAMPGEGKTTTAINLATTLAEAGESVLLIDADLRRPTIAEYLHLEKAVGLTTVLIGRARLDDVTQQMGATGLDVLTSGEIPPNPAELLGSPAMKRLLAEVGEHYNTVIIDSPPLLPVTDAAILTSEADGALMVVGSGGVKSLQVVTAIDSVERGGGSLLGLVLNKLKDERQGYHKQGYYYYHSKPNGPEAGTKATRPAPVGAAQE